MKRQGDYETNPRFIQLSNQLMAIQRAQSMKSAQAQHLQHQQQQQQQAQPPQQQQQSSQQPQQPRQVETSQIHSSPSGMQGSPVMSISQQRPQENGQPNGILPALLNSD